MRASLLEVAGTLCLLVVACATATPGAQPGDMSAAAHEQQAGEHARTGQQHAGEYRRDAGVERLRCSPSGGRPGPNGSAVLAESICWTSVENPTAAHLDEAEKHRRHAADHRAASVALRQAEARACVGISEADRDMSPFEHREDIVAVAPLVVPEADARAMTPAERLLGAAVTFRAVRGLTAECLQRVVDCHLARNAAFGRVVPEMPDCPLVPRGVQARVTSAASGLVVEIRASHPAGAREVLARAQRLTAASPQGRASTP
jgi:hypothetical protein